MVDRTGSSTRHPSWWTHKHTSAWDRVKGAVERDWEQTKADLSKSGGQKLNQNVADTVKQSVGAEPIPPHGVKTRPTEPEVAAKDVRKAHESMQKESVKAAETVATAHEDIAKERAKLGEKVGEIKADLAKERTKAGEKIAGAHASATDEIADARGKAAVGVAKGNVKIEEAGAKLDKAVTKWHDAEAEISYGYSVRSQYPAGCVWDDKLEGKLGTEWDALETGRPWTGSRAEIRRGWDQADKKV